MSEEQADYDTDAGPRFDTAENGSVVTCRSLHIAKMTKVLSAPRRRQVARIFAAAGTAAHELPDEYDPVAAVEALPDLIEALELIEQRPSDGNVSDELASHSVAKFALQKARRDDE